MTINLPIFVFLALVAALALCGCVGSPVSASPVAGKRDDPSPVSTLARCSDLRYIAAPIGPCVLNTP